MNLASTNCHGALEKQCFCRHNVLIAALRFK
ncbi:unnamed protein product (plasmid) [Mycetohabitans rhizoxinica HKI 454]|uniref:Uncharacterized protein n=1 Tax=Mycetohabitans rhizoxinica (strain DSM 19002 / CIP 109453 / HKI 454) TaxID=882378 RepID=E5AW73_MYCRK|nr:unnamed protein product [Mycetohabitans rhizoxinica HKI 454]